jgi:hypothetical protein
VRQRTQLINAIRGHLTEYGWITPKGPSHVAMLDDLIDEEEMASSLPEAAHAMFRLMLDLLTGLNDEIADLEEDRATRSRERGIAQADDRSRHRSNFCHRDRRPGTASRDLCPRAATLPPGWVSRLFKDRQAASRSSVRHPKWANARSDACSSLAVAPS